MRLLLSVLIALAGATVGVGAASGHGDRARGTVAAAAWHAPVDPGRPHGNRDRTARGADRSAGQDPPGGSRGHGDGGGNGNGNGHGNQGDQGNPGQGQGNPGQGHGPPSNPGQDQGPPGNRGHGNGNNGGQGDQGSGQDGQPGNQAGQTSRHGNGNGNNGGGPPGRSRGGGPGNGNGNGNRGSDGGNRGRCGASCGHPGTQHTGPPTFTTPNPTPTPTPSPRPRIIPVVVVPSGTSHFSGNPVTRIPHAVIIPTGALGETTAGLASRISTGDPLGGPVSSVLPSARTTATVRATTERDRDLERTAQRAAELAAATRPLGPSVIAHFVRFIPSAIWFALTAALALAALAGGAALWSGGRMRRQAAKFSAMSTAALTDALTGVLNRRGFIDAAERELARARRYGRPFVLAYVDVRGLKAVNDTSGHQSGDRLLQGVAGLLKDSARADDVVGRIGGDEMALLLAEQSAEGAAVVTNRIKEQVPERRAGLGLATDWDLTIGTAAYPEDGDSVDDLLAAADRRLYEQRGIALR